MSLGTLPDVQPLPNVDVTPERIAACLKACEGVADPVKEIGDLRRWEVKTIEALEKRVNGLRNYVSHNETCDVHKGRRCDCGLKVWI